MIVCIIGCIFTKTRSTMPNCITCQSELTGKQTKFCSRKCHNQSGNAKFQNYVAQQVRGLERKIKAIKNLGGECTSCGYKNNISALEFHHLDPSLKTLALDLRAFSNNSQEVLDAELANCTLLCSNCHRELENPQLGGLL